MKIYIDIDGVLLDKSLKPSIYGKEFIQFLTDNFECYWLTTHCRGGENKAVNYLEKYYDEETVERIKLIKKTDWMDKKTEAIDFNCNFIWLDDYPFNVEKVDLKNNNCFDSLIVVDLSNENELQTIKENMKTKA